MQTAHDIPLKAIVEVINPRLETFGLRLFVVEHSFDFDVTPVYGLSCFLNAAKEAEELQHRKDNLAGDPLSFVAYKVSYGQIDRGYVSDDLSVVQAASKDDGLCSVTAECKSSDGGAAAVKTHEIYKVIREFRLSNMLHGEGDHYYLVDAMTAEGRSIDDGEEQMLSLAGEIAHALNTRISASLPET